MTVREAFEIAFAVLIALGGGGAIVFALSAWLGKVWADRLMIQERAKHDKELTVLSAELRHISEQEITNIKNELDIFKEKHLRGYADKIGIYRLTVDIIAEMLGDLDYMQNTKQPPPDAFQRYDKFNRNRLRAYGYLAMLAPQHVMNAFDAMFDHLIIVAKGHEPYEWTKVRKLSIAFINEVRKDVGIDKSPVEYKGNL
jgi:hypothetical protein